MFLPIWRLPIAILRTAPRDRRPAFGTRRTAERRRRLRHEPLEDRRVLAAVTVTNTLDVVNGDVTSIAALVADDGGDGIALREAVEAANNTAGADDITFDFGDSGSQTILLDLGELELTEALTITGAGPDLLTIDAQQNSRVFNITATTGDFTFTGLTLTGGMTTGNNTYAPLTTDHSGGAIRSLSTGLLKIDRATVANSSTEGDYASGGGIFAIGDVVLTDAIITGNSTLGVSAHGGGVYSAQTVNAVNSTFSSNHTAGEFALGGAIRVDVASITSSLVTGNHTLGPRSFGGGISTDDALTLDETTISENYTSGDYASGGGAFAKGETTIADSSVLNNYTAGAQAAGGGIYAFRDATINKTSITGNSTLTTLGGEGYNGSGPTSSGGGILVGGYAHVSYSLIAGNAVVSRRAGGGGIRAGRLALSNSTVRKNSATEFGGGIRAGMATLRDSTVSDNDGSGISGDTVVVTRSLITGNNSNVYGGGINGSAVTVTDSTVSQNVAFGRGGGINAYSLQMTRSLLSENRVEGPPSALGGGAFTGMATIVDSTISGNVAISDRRPWGGGLLLSGDAEVLRTTITNNQVLGGDSDGGGIANVNSALDLSDSIIAGNTSDGTNPDLTRYTGPLTVNHSLIGDTSDLTSEQLDMINAGVDNLLDVDPMLGPLADNGGPRLPDGSAMMTHALSPGSPAIDAGDPTFVGPPYLDQRGFYRVVDGDGNMTARVDMGAFEYASIAPLAGDGNLDGVVDGLDYIIWTLHFGEDPAADPPGAPLNGDYNGDGVVDGLDYTVWATNFVTSQLTLLPYSQPAKAEPSARETIAAVDAVLQNDSTDRPAINSAPNPVDWQISRAFDAVLEKTHG